MSVAHLTGSSRWNDERAGFGADRLRGGEIMTCRARWQGGLVAAVMSLGIVTSPALAADEIVLGSAISQTGK
jgi:hypothetical protein